MDYVIYRTQLLLVKKRVVAGFPLSFIKKNRKFSFLKNNFSFPHLIFFKNGIFAKKMKYVE